LRKYDEVDFLNQDYRNTFQTSTIVQTTSY